MIASGLLNFIRIVCLIFFNFTFKTFYVKFKKSIRAQVQHRAFATLIIIVLYRVVDYDSKWSTKFYKDCMFDIFVILLLRRLNYDKLFFKF